MDVPGELNSLHMRRLSELRASSVVDIAATNAAAVALQALANAHASRHKIYPTLGADPVSLASIGRREAVSAISPVQTMGRPTSNITQTGGRTHAALAIAQASGSFSKIVWRQNTAIATVTMVGIVYDGTTLAKLRVTANQAAAQGAGVLHNAVLNDPTSGLPSPLDVVQGTPYFLAFSADSNMSIAGEGLLNAPEITLAGAVLETRMMVGINASSLVGSQTQVTNIWRPWMYLTN